MSSKYPMPLSWAFQYADPNRKGNADAEAEVWYDSERYGIFDRFFELRALSGEEDESVPHLRKLSPDKQLGIARDWLQEIGSEVSPERFLESVLSLRDEWDDADSEWFDNLPPVDYGNLAADRPPFTASQRWREGAKETGEALVRIGANPSHHLVALYMLAHAHKDTGEMFPSYSTLAALTGLSQRSTVADAVRWLVAHKVLKRTREARRDGTPAMYVFNPVERWKP